MPTVDVSRGADDDADELHHDTIGSDMLGDDGFFRQSLGRIGS